MALVTADGSPDVAACETDDETLFKTKVGSTDVLSESAISDVFEVSPRFESTDPAPPPTMTADAVCITVSLRASR